MPLVMFFLNTILFIAYGFLGISVLLGLFFCAVEAYDSAVIYFQKHQTIRLTIVAVIVACIMSGVFILEAKRTKFA